MIDETGLRQRGTSLCQGNGRRAGSLPVPTCRPAGSWGTRCTAATASCAVRSKPGNRRPPWPSRHRAAEDLPPYQPLRARGSWSPRRPGRPRSPRAPAAPSGGAGAGRRREGRVPRAPVQQPLALAALVLGATKGHLSVSRGRPDRPNCARGVAEPRYAGRRRCAWRGGGAGLASRTSWR